MAKVATQKGYTPSKRRADYNTVFTSEAGKRVLNDLAVVHFLYAPTEAVDANGISENIPPHEYYIREGRRRVIVDILQAMNVELKEPQKHITNLMEQFPEEQNGIAVRN